MTEHGSTSTGVASQGPSAPHSGLFRRALRPEHVLGDVGVPGKRGWLEGGRCEDLPGPRGLGRPQGCPHEPSRSLSLELPFLVFLLDSTGFSPGKL